jgi:molecular chaperone IbpA
MVMRTIDFSPLFRSSVGFDRMQRVMDAALRTDATMLSYPPYNIEARGDDAYRITMAVAGFSRHDVEMTIAEDTLTVAGNSKKDEDGVAYLHRGIAGRSFERKFQLAEHIEVKEAVLRDGLLHIDLERRIPEGLKPRRIEFGTASRATAIKAQAAA